MYASKASSIPVRQKVYGHAASVPASHSSSFGQQSELNGKENDILKDYIISMKVLFALFTRRYTPALLQNGTVFWGGPDAALAKLLAI